MESTSEDMYYVEYECKHFDGQLRHSKLKTPTTETPSLKIIVSISCLVKGIFLKSLSLSSCSEYGLEADSRCFFLCILKKAGWSQSALGCKTRHTKFRNSGFKPSLFNLSSKKSQHITYYEQSPRGI